MSPAQDIKGVNFVTVKSFRLLPVTAASVLIIIWRGDEHCIFSMMSTAIHEILLRKV